MRKLASVQQIARIRPIINSDFLEVAEVNGWECVVKKGEFNSGDVCVYFEIDSFLPVRPEFEFLRKSCFRSTTNLGDGFRIKTIRLRGQISQGLVLGLNSLDIDPSKYDVGYDLTDYLGVKKYEALVPLALGGDAKCIFPSFVPKTDAERFQNLINKYHRDIDEMLHVEWEVTMKLDGTSMTLYAIYDDATDSIVDDGVASRNIIWKETAGNVYWQFARSSGIYDVWRDFCKRKKRSFAIQGELMGPGIQGNPENLSTHHLFVFDIFDIDKQRYLNAEERYTILKLELEKNNVQNVRHVPWFDFHEMKETEINTNNHLFNFLADSFLANYSDIANHDNFTAYAKGLINQTGEVLSSYTGKYAEGLVFRSTDSRHKFKIISNNWLLKNEV